MLVGNAITSETLRADVRYANEKNISASLISSYTLERKEEFDSASIEIVNGFKEEYKKDAVLVRIYNATGGPIQFHVEHTWKGEVWKFPLDDTIANGQWSVFLHSYAFKLGGAVGNPMSFYDSFNALVFRGTTAKEDLFLGWKSHRTVYSTGQERTEAAVYVENRPYDQWPSKGSWTYMENLIKRSGVASTDVWSFKVTGHIGSSNISPLLNFEISHP